MPDPFLIVGAAVAAFVAFFGLRRWAAKKEAESFLKGPPPADDELDDPSLAPSAITLQVGADGAMRILTGRGAVEMSSPTPEPDPGEPSRDAVDVALRLAEETADRPYEPSYVEAATLLRREKRDVPKLSAPLRALFDASDADDETAFVTAAEAIPDEGWGVVEALGAARWPVPLAQLAQREGYDPLDVLIATVAQKDPDECASMLATVEDPTGRLIASGSAVLANDALPLSERWTELGLKLEQGWQSHYWHEIEVRRLVKKGALTEALAILDRISEDDTISGKTQRVAMKALAEDDPDAARERLEQNDGEPWDRLPTIHGLHDAGVDVEEEIEAAIEGLTPHTYRVPEVFSFLLDLAFHDEDPERLRRVLVRAGAHAWQVTSRCTVGIRRLAVSQSDALDDCLEACLERHEPGAVASRDASAGLAAGHVMMRPRWLTFEEVHPLEILVLQAALTDELPQWIP